ncbi:MAG: Uma2 family endonuclease [Cyanobacteria bacterium P01_A01_bin.114]
MVQFATPKYMTVEEYLAYDSGTDARYELIDGELVDVPPESPLNVRIGMFLMAQFIKLVPLVRVCHKDAELQLASKRAKFRYPDLVILSEEGVTALDGKSRNTIFLDMPAPLLVVEIVSPDDPSRDYRQKRSEYAVREIPEYWIVDPLTQKITMLTLREGFYDETVFVDNQTVQSPTLPEFSWTVAQILNYRE